MKVLSLYWGLSSTASLFVDNKVVGAVSEERFTRIKNDDVFPARSIDFLLKEHKLSPDQLDGVAIASYIQGLTYTITRKAKWTIRDYLREQRERWYPEVYEGKSVNLLDLFSDKIDKSLYPSKYWAEDLKLQAKQFDADRETILAEFLGIAKAKVRRIEHHRCHATYGYYSSPFRNKKVLAFTIDGSGDGKNATINIVQPDGSVERVFSTDNCHIGRIYRYITLLLGMKPNEHEYKVMGLAPYGSPKIAEAALEVFRSTLYVDGLDFKFKEKPKDSYYWFKEKLEGLRFDGVAAALQTWTEELLTQWIANAIDRFNIGTIVLSGGVSMNVKANGKIAELPQVKELFIGGSGSDESMALSSGICLAQDLTLEKGEAWHPASIPYFESLYLGPIANREQEMLALKQLDSSKFLVKEGYTPDDIAILLKAGNILARCCGRMEFGQRSLGNRSILADPIHMDIVPKINKMIKNRDFWMPFAPMVMDRYAPKYILNPKDIHSPHMTLAFQTTPEGWAAMPAGCHPGDRSARAQILTQKANPDLYAIFESFEKLTGRGALLNTSFNLHGFPIVNTPEEAVDVLLRSGLDGIILNNYVVTRR